MIDPNKTTITVNGREVHSGLFNDPTKAPQESVLSEAEEAANLIFDMGVQLSKMTPFSISDIVCSIQIEEWREEGEPNVIPLSSLKTFIKSKQDENGNIGFDLVARLRKSDPNIIYLEVADD